MPDRAPFVPEASEAAQPQARRGIVLETRDLWVWHGSQALLREVTVPFAAGAVTCVTGPSGAGKSTLLRALNRLLDLDPGLRVEGQVLLEGEPVYAPGVDVDRLRTRVGMLFQQPVVFPGSIRDNVLFAARRLRSLARRHWDERVHQVLAEVGLWEEVRGRLAQPAASLSVGQQQRLCLARSLILEPRVLLLDEPTSALDAGSREAIEALILRRRGRQSFVVVTHDLAQARRLADRALCVTRHEGSGVVQPCSHTHPELDDPACRTPLSGGRS